MCDIHEMRFQCYFSCHRDFSDSSLLDVELLNAIIHTLTLEYACAPIYQRQKKVIL
jgi:hypothetical protein